MDVVSNWMGGNGTNVTTYFFTQILDTHGAKEMYGIFKLYGKVVDVVLPAKKDKGGKGSTLSALQRCITHSFLQQNWTIL